jgi:hypothetical protein
VIALLLFGAIMLAAGFLFGKLHERDSRPFAAPRPRLHIHLERVEWKQLELPSVHRRQQIARSMIWGRDARQPQEPS